ncbi:MAG: hypothetical protein JWO78_1751 [Micavibrio sp.]|nr:hypothetical protein [Micavibrio sp.]
MKTIEDVLETMEDRIDRTTLESYIAREWLRPMSGEHGWVFEEIDIARVQLVYDLTQNLNVNDEGMDVVLSLLDQLYGLRTHMQKLTYAVEQQPSQIQTEIMMIIKQYSNGGSL